MRYLHRILVDSHDPRNIDVAVLSRYPIISVRSHRHERNANNTSELFSRDCLEVDIDVSGKLLVLYVNHFKSMMEGREKTRAKRVEQAKRVVEIVNNRWSDSNYKGNFVVLGDLNDYPGQGTSLDVPLNHLGMENIILRLPANEQWTHFYAGGNEYKQLDYIFLSKLLAQQSNQAPIVMRKGLPYRAENIKGFDLKMLVKRTRKPLIMHRFISTLN